MCEHPQNVGNGNCDDYNNVPECNYDGGDCCGSCVNKEHCSNCTCLDGGSGNGIANSLIENSFCDDGLNNAECQFDGGDCCVSNVNTDFCTLCQCIEGSCIQGWIADGYCNDVNNHEACFFDGGDCCGSNVNTNRCTDCLCLQELGGCKDSWIGDGWCDGINNNLACIYDGGDCCLIVRVSLTNELLNVGLGFEVFNGDYEISIAANGKTRWINGDYAIWYWDNKWIIGTLADIGGEVGYIYSYNAFFGLTDDENEWNYLQEGVYISPTDPSDVQITCVM